MAKYRTRKDRTRIPEGETPLDKFHRLGERRCNRALTAIRLLGNLASSNYDYKPEDVRMLELVITRAVEATFAKFRTVKPKPTTIEFHFPRPAPKALATGARRRAAPSQPVPQVA